MEPETMLVVAWIVGGFSAVGVMALLMWIGGPR